MFGDSVKTIQAHEYLRYKLRRKQTQPLQTFTSTSDSVQRAPMSPRPGKTLSSGKDTIMRDWWRKVGANICNRFDKSLNKITHPQKIQLFRVLIPGTFQQTQALVQRCRLCSHPMSLPPSLCSQPNPPQVENTRQLWNQDLNRGNK